MFDDDMHAGGGRDHGSDSADNYIARDHLAFPPVPKDLEYLLTPAILLGRKYRFDNDVQRFAESAEESDMETLSSLAERARLAGDYARVLQWSDEIAEIVEIALDKRFPYTITISDERKTEFLQLINPGIPDDQKERAVRESIEAEDDSDAAQVRRKMRLRLLKDANDQVHHMDIYFLFGLMDACDLRFEPE